MSDPKLISPMLDNFAMGDPFSDRNGVRCCPAMRTDTEDKYIVKIISIPSSPRQLEALLLSGAYNDKESALAYYHDLANGIIEETQALEKLSRLDGFVPYEQAQIVPMEDEAGYDVYLLSTYKNTLRQFYRCKPMTHLGALNLGLDLCTALSVCRQSGYLYVDLKPDNIYLTSENAYRIGDIGFLKLDSLKYASLPDRYRSQYTAPEIQDAYSSLNTTVDIYAVGLILYQAFNDGTLPFRNEFTPEEAFPPPAYADYEMAEIILKACAPDPSERWQDPVEMAQALISYMQRNGAHDTPIIPEPVSTEESTDNDAEDTDVTSVLETNQDVNNEDIVEQPDDEVISDSVDDISGDNNDAIYIEDSEGNLTFLTDDAFEEADLEAEAQEIDYEEVTEEVSEILVQADELIAHPAPDPVIPPEPIDVPIPEPLPLEDEENTVGEDEADAEIDSEYTDSDEATNCEEPEIAEEVDDADAEEIDNKDNEEDWDEDDDFVPSRRSHWLRNTLIAVIAVALLALGFLYYKNIYTQTIESLELEDLTSDSLTVHLASQVDEQILKVICSDTYGNQLPAPVKDGKAVFTNLAPNTAYNIRVEINGFYKLTGQTTASFTTPAKTNIVQFDAVTGSEDGSVILRFTIDGPDSQQWTIHYSASGEPEKEVTFSGHITTLTGLTIGKEYTFTLQPVDDILTTGTNQIKHTASNIIQAENLLITGCIDGKLSVMWSAPEGITVDSWTVRCYSENGYDTTAVCTNTNAVFEGVDLSTSHTVEVTAIGMSVNQHATADANAVTVTMTIDDSDPNNLVLSWTPAGSAPEDGWLLQYDVNAGARQELTCSEDNTAIIPARIPGAQYRFTLQAADGTPVLGGSLSYKSEEADDFEGYGVDADSMEFKMCKTPKSKNWDRYDLKKSDYTTSFESGQKASFLVHLTKAYSTSPDNITTLFVIRDANEAIISTSTITSSWTNMWYRNYCELDVPAIPISAGEYTITVYFNGAFAHEQTFTVTN